MIEMKMQQICIVCGSPAFAGNFCEKCFLERNGLFEVPEKIQLKHCTSCGAYYDKAWRSELLEQLLKGKVRSRNRLARIDVRIKRGAAVFSCSGYIAPSRNIKHEERKAVLAIERRKCDTCVKLSGGYYEAVIQVRGDKKEKIMRKVVSSAGNDAMVQEAKNGYDVRFLDKKSAARTAGLLKFFDIKRTYKLVTEKKGKKIYRDYYSVR